MSTTHTQRAARPNQKPRRPARGRRVNQVMVKGNYGTHAQRCWAALRMNIDDLARCYNLHSWAHRDKGERGRIADSFGTVTVDSFWRRNLKPILYAEDDMLRSRSFGAVEYGGLRASNCCVRSPRRV